MDDTVTTATRRDEGAGVVRRMFGDGFLDENMGAAYHGDSPEAAMSE